MKANELRVGNIVFEPLNENKRAFKVFEIYHEEDYDKINYHNALSFEPVQLNEEWLKNLGFEDKQRGFYSIKCGSTFFRLTPPQFMGEWQTEYCWVYDDLKFTEVKYVHQLQNLYFILCGVELQLTAP